jgi:galactose mutarotase-like enzyme
MFHLETNQLKIGIDSKGAELKSVFHKQHNLEYMWQADPKFWAKTSPVLFPIVGQLKENAYRYKDKSYQLPRHGFARDRVFSVVEQNDRSITFCLNSSQDTLTVYPFSFLFFIIYSLQDDVLTVTYRVQNKGQEEMLFSVGGHPAFNVPLVAGTTYTDYYLRFNKEETAGRWPISSDGRIGTTPEPLLKGTNVLPLAKRLFERDAIVLKHLQSEQVTLGSDKTPHGLLFTFSGFPFLGIWAAPNADFVCIEPWCGIADSVDADGELAHKEGINKLAPAETFSVEWKVWFY